jgi:phosphoenolpyruvate carboxykinase (ATP)
VWLINTGWSGGPYGVGKRFEIKYTRAMVNAILNNQLNDVPTEREPHFGLNVPTYCPNVPTEVLNPRNTWQNPADYDVQAKKLAAMFVENFKNFEAQSTPAIIAAGPSV